MIANAMPQTTNPIPPINWQLTALGILAIPYKEREHLGKDGSRGRQSLSNPWVHGHSHNVSTVNVDVAVNGGRIIVISPWQGCILSGISCMGKENSDARLPRAKGVRFLPF